MKSHKCLVILCVINIISVYFLYSRVSGLVDEPPRKKLSVATFKKAGEEIVEAINRNDQEAILRMLSRPVRELNSPESIKKTIDWVIQQKGKIKRIGECVVVDDSAHIYLVAERGSWNLSFVLTADGLLAGFMFRDAPPAIPTPLRNSVRLNLPFRGEWHVKWGGLKIEDNFHFEFDGDTKYASDFTLLDNEDFPFRNNGETNEDFYAYNEEVVAVAVGEVVTVVEGVYDNRPGSINPHSNSGNMVIIKHAANEYSCYMHLRMRSVLVKVGDRVETGQVLGRCGNSGLSSGPHLHFHMMNTEIAADASGFPAYFSDVLLSKDGKSKHYNEYLPIKGDYVKSK
jgi:murein DD-endopeptidase MepM/ murein hydrolase activator NlpD